VKEDVLRPVCNGARYGTGGFSNSYVSDIGIDLSGRLVSTQGNFIPQRPHCKAMSRKPSHSVCLVQDVFMEPVALKCGHVFCKTCACRAARIHPLNPKGLKMAVKSARCPICRQVRRSGSCIVRHLLPPRPRSCEGLLSPLLTKVSFPQVSPCNSRC
jgi:hypothetical protein